MRLPQQALRAAFAAVLLSPLAAALEPQEHVFRSPLLNGRGIERLSDLRGTPVVIEFWGRH